MLYRSTDRLSRRGAPVQNLAHSASFESLDKDAPSKAGTKQLGRRSAVEPVIGHAKAEHRMGRNYFAGTHGDANNPVLAAAGYNFRRLLEWLALLLFAILADVSAAASQERPLKSA